MAPNNIPQPTPSSSQPSPLPKPIMLFGSLIQPIQSDQRLVVPLPAASVPKPGNDNLSPQLRRLLLQMGVAEDHNPTHFFTRKLFASDVNRFLARLNIPRNQLLASFLTDQEEALLRDRDHNGELNNLEVPVIDPFLVTRILTLARWDFKKSDTATTSRGTRRTRSWSYALNGGWMDVVDCNRLVNGDTVQVWSFRKMDDSLGFIIFKVDKPSATADNVDGHPVLDHGPSSSDHDNDNEGNDNSTLLNRKRGSSSSLSTITTV